MLKNIVRTISPFTKKSSAASTTSTNSKNQVQQDYSSYEWDLSVVDLKQALKAFYKKHNPEKSFIVNEILAKYVGEEETLLRQLCERYQLSQQDMQDYLDQAPLKDDNKRSMSRQSSFSSLTLSRPRTNSEDHHSISPQQQLLASSAINKKKAASSNNNNATSSSGNNKRGGGDDAVSVADYYWDVSEVDVGLALQRVYKKYNPTKAPNVSVLQDKTEAEILALLRQLCKRHALSEADMQVFLDDAPLYQQEVKSPNPAPRPPARRASNAAKQHQPGEISPLTTDTNDQQKASGKSKYGVNSPSTAKTAQIFQSLKKDKIPIFQDDFEPEDDYTEQDEEQQRQEQEVEMLRSKIKNPTNIIVARPPTKQNPPPSKRASMPPHAPPPAPQAAQYYQRQDDDTEERSTFSTKHLQPVVAGQQVVPLLNEMKKNRRYSISRVSMTSMRGVEQQDEDDYDEDERIRQAAEEKKSRSSPTRNLSIKQGRPFAFGSNNNQQYEDEEDHYNYASQSRGNNNKTSEVDQLKRELQESREQIDEMNRESNELVKLLKEAMEAKNAKPSPTKAVVTTASKAIQADDKSAQDEIQRLKHALQSEEDRCRSLESDQERRLQNITKLEKNVNALQEIVKSLQADKTDLLQLINILSSAPLAAKSVLESYLAKLGGNAPKGSLLREKVLDAKTLPMGDRIDQLLQWKRGKDRKRSEGREEEDHESNFDPEQDESEDERYLIEGGDSDLEDDQQQASSNNKSNKGGDDDLLLLSPSERKLYEGMNVNKAGNKKGQASNKANSSNRKSSPATFSTTSNSMKSNVGDDMDSVDEKHLILSEQYELAKKYFQHQRSQTKLSEQMAKTNLTLQEIDTEKTIKNTLTRSASPNPALRLNNNGTISANTNVTTTSSSNSRPTSSSRISSRSASPAVGSSSGANVTSSSSAGKTSGNSKAQPTASDWVECFDPRSQRKYYYSATLKKSTWSKPAEFNSASGAAAGPGNSKAEDKSKPSGNAQDDEYDSTEEFDDNNSKRGADTKNRTDPPSRAASPSGPLRNWSSNSSNNSATNNSRPSSVTSRSTSSSRSRGSNNQNGSTDGASAWVTAVDPKTQRKYWYNRESVFGLGGVERYTFELFCTSS